MRSQRADVRLKGELDVETAARARQQIHDAIDRSADETVIVSLQGLTFVDSSGLGLLVGAQKRARDRGVDLRYLPPPERLWRTFTATGLDRVLPFTSVPA
jgi:anti-anti-sigma factor